MNPYLYVYQARMLQVLGRARHVTVLLMSAHNMTGPADQLRHCVWTARRKAVWMAMWDVDEVPASTLSLTRLTCLTSLTTLITLTIRAGAGPDSTAFDYTGTRPGRAALRVAHCGRAPPAAEPQVAAASSA